jgi:hypothetical protein
LDSRLTIYTRVGDAFAIACAAATSMLILMAIVRKTLTRARTNDGEPR